MEIKQRDIVVIQYPFSDFSAAKIRPAIVISRDEHNQKSRDIVAVPLTSNLAEIDYSFIIGNNNLESGKLIVKSRVRVDRIFSISKEIIRMKVGRVKEEILDKSLELLFGLTKKAGAKK